MICLYYRLSISIFILNFCKLVCPNLPTLVNGMVTYNPEGSSDARPLGSTATYSCSDGFDLVGGTATRTCQSDSRWSGSTAPTCQAGVFLRLDGVVYPNNSNFLLSDIGVLSESLMCVTDLTPCCSNLIPGSEAFGEWFFPNGTLVISSGMLTALPDTKIYRDRGNQFVRLNVRNNPTGPFGTYCCEVPTASGEIGRVCANIVVVDCGPPPSLLNGSPGTPTRTSLGGTVTYSCNEGFSLSGTVATVSCQINGNWDTPSTCSPDGYFQVRLNGVSCLQWRETESLSKRDAIASGVADGVEAICQCGFNRDYISQGVLLCFEDSPQHVTFRGQLQETSQANTATLLLATEQWVQSTSNLPVLGILLAINTTCPVAIAGLGVTECPEALTIVNSTDPMRAPPDQTGAVIGRVVAAVIAVAAIATVVMTVVTVCLVMKYRQPGKKTYDVDTRQVRLSDGSYEEPNPLPPQMNYNVSQCPAYTITGRGNTVTREEGRGVAMGDTGTGSRVQGARDEGIYDN